MRKEAGLVFDVEILHTLAAGPHPGPRPGGRGPRAGAGHGGAWRCVATVPEEAAEDRDSTQGQPAKAVVPVEGASGRAKGSWVKRSDG